MTRPSTSSTPVPSFSPMRLLPLVVLVAGLVLFFALGMHRYVNFAALRANRQALLTWVEHAGLLAPLAYMAVYAVAIAFSLPVATVLTITGGFLFGAAWGTLYTVVGATLGATALFLIAKTAFGDVLRAKAGPTLHKMAAGFQENALSYLLILRLVPLFPFFVVNLAPALLGVALPTYVLATCLGIIPGTFAYASAGAGLGSIFDAGEAFTVANVLTPEIRIAMVALIILALLPVAYKKLKARTAE